MSKTAAIEFLKAQLVAVESDRKKTLAAIAAAQVRFPQLDAEVQALKLLLAKHTGEANQLPPSSPSIQQPTSGDSVASLAVRALTEAGKPQTTAQLLGFLKSHGKETTSATLRSTIYHSAQKGKLFKVVSAGVFGLIEWEDRR